MTISGVANHLKPTSAMDSAKVRPSKVFKLPSQFDQTQPLAQQLQPLAQIVVGQTFYGTLLKQTQDNPYKDERLTGGRGGEMFQSLYHQRLSEQMVRGSGQKLVKAMVKKLTRNFESRLRGVA